MKRIILVLALCILAATSAHAQKDLYDGVVSEVEYKSFNSVNVSDDFILRLVTSDKFKTRVISDKRLENYVKTYLQNGTLFITLDRKNFTPELKKSLKAKGAPAPVLEVEVYFPALGLLEMSDNVILHKSDVIYADTFTLKLTDKARVDKLYLDCRTAELNLAKSSYADVEVMADEKLFISTANNSKVVVNQIGKEIKVETAGSSAVDAILEVENADIISSGSSSAKLITGKVGVLTVDAIGSSQVDAESVSIPKGELHMEGFARCYTDVTDTLKVNMTGNAMVTFKNKPYIDVERIVGSTLIKADDPKRR